MAAVIVIAAATVPAWGSSAIMKQAVTLLTLIALAQMWNLLAGYAGLVSVGQQAFIGIGAYTLWVFSEKVGLNPFVCVVYRRRRRGAVRRTHGRAGLPAARRLLRRRHLGDRRGVPAARDPDLLAGRRIGGQHQQRGTGRARHPGDGRLLAGSRSGGRLDRPGLSASAVAARARAHRHPRRRDRSPRAGGERASVQALGLHHRGVRHRDDRRGHLPQPAAGSSPRRPSASTGAP